MDRSETTPERRQALRVAHALEARYSCDCAPIDARILDLSERGLFLDTTHPLETGMTVDLSFTLPETTVHPEPQTIEGQGRVVWCEPMVGVGVEFVDLAEADRERIRFFVAEVFFRDVTEEA